MLQRRLSLLQAVSLNMAMMVGVGPFITIPQFVGALGGPHAALVWLLAAAVAVADGLVWSELAAAFPGSGGTYHFYDAIYGEARVGRLLKFLFVWQFLFSGPLELATGMIGLVQYAAYLWPWLAAEVLHAPLPGGVAWVVTRGQGVAVLLMGAVTALAYRRIEAAGRLMVVLWAGVVLTLAWVLVAGFSRFDPALVRDVPEGAWRPDLRLVLGVGAALRIAMYDFLGYYQISYLGDEVAEPSRTIPRSILISVAIISAVYLAMTVAILGVIPWERVVRSPHIATDLIGELSGARAARAVTLMIVWCAAAGTYAILLGYSRIPYAAARAGHFFRGLARTHPTGDFPHRSLLLVGALSALACLGDLGTLIDALLIARIPVQFLGQVATVAYLRTRPDLRARMPFRMPLYPLPALVALAGWLFLIATTSRQVVVYGLASLLLGLGAFAAWDRGGGGGLRGSGEPD